MRTLSVLIYNARSDIRDAIEERTKRIRQIEIGIAELPTLQKELAELENVAAVLKSLDPDEVAE